MTIDFYTVRRVLLFFLLLLPVLPSYFGFKLAGSPLLNFSRSVSVFIFFTACLFLLSGRLKVPQYLRRNIALFVIFGGGYVVSRFISAVLSPDKVYSFFIFFLDVITVYCVFLFSLIFFYRREGVRLKSLSLIYFIPFLFIFVMVLFEGFFEKNLFVYLSSSTLSGTDYIVSALKEKVREGEYRSQGPFLHPLVLSQYVNFITPLLLLFLSASMINRVATLFFGVTVVVMSIFCILESGSRSGLIVLFAQLAIFFSLVLIRDSRKWVVMCRLLAFVPFALIALYLVFSSSLFQGVITGGTQSESMSTEARFTQYSRGVEALKSSPVFGFGPGNAIEYAFTENITTGERSIDSYYLNVMVDSGYFSLALYVLLVCMFSFFLLKRALIYDWKVARYYVFVLCSFAAVLATSLTLSSYELFTYYSITFAVLLGRAESMSENFQNV